jgi:glycosyltransferase involved in cell wall biosynthesis
VLEAMACDVPVVCSDILALREVSGGHATLVPFGDFEAMGAALTAVLHEPLPLPLLATRRAHAAEFTWRRCAELTVDAYRRASDNS